MINWFQLLGGAALLYFGAEWFVGGASRLALALRIPQLIVGLTVVAYGTSAPEVIVGIRAAMSGHGDVALGNVIGSNIANVGLILGVTALIRPARVDGGLRARELPVLVVSAGLVPLALLNSVVDRWEAALLLSGALGYTLWMVHAARSATEQAQAALDTVATAEIAQTTGAPPRGGRGQAIAVALLGLAILLLGGDNFITGAVAVARQMGMSDRLVGLTVVAVGTSLPELVTSVVAARRGHSDIAVGNVMGSNIFNVLLCLGASALAGNVGAAPATLVVDLAALVLMTCLAAVFIRSERTITRGEGAVALASYAAYMTVTMTRG